jgi:hypothetical protein
VIDKLTATPTLNGRIEAVHRFLRLLQPISRSQLPENGIFEAGKIYKFPFTFVVPTHLLPRACAHKCDNDHVKEAHLLLPPSFGDSDLCGYDGRPLDDLSPDMARVLYCINVKMSRWRDDGTENVVAKASKKLRIKPAYEEQPPINIDSDEEYCGRLEKTLRKGLVKGKLGHLVMEASQPKSFRLPATPPGDAIPPITTMVKLKLRFDPHDESSQPPRLNSLSSKLKVRTFFASTPQHAFPSKATTFPDMSQGYISHTILLSTRCVASVDWQRHEPGFMPSTSPPRRDSAVSTCSSDFNAVPAPSSHHHQHLPFYTAIVIVPLSLPTKKYFVPTFHNCIVSRIYALSLHLSTQGQPLGPSLTLRIPVQISAEGSLNSVERRRMCESAEEAVREADAVFEPRLVGPGLRLATMETQESNDMPPGYEGLGFEYQVHGRSADGGAGERVAMGGSAVAGVLVCG